MPTRNVVLTEHQEEFVERLVTSGRYQNVSEVLREGLRMIESREVEDRVRLKALRDAANAGVADIEAGRFASFDTVEAVQSYFKGATDKALGKMRPE
jgi:antitoxin ParD1/3/4